MLVALVLILVLVWLLENDVGMLPVADAAKGATPTPLAPAAGVLPGTAAGALCSRSAAAATAAVSSALPESSWCHLLLMLLAVSGLFETTVASVGAHARQQQRLGWSGCLELGLLLPPARSCSRRAFVLWYCCCCCLRAS
jgi:hypothetical protein